MSTIPVSFEFFPPNTPEGLARLRDTRRQLAGFEVHHRFHEVGSFKGLADFEAHVTGTVR